MKSRIFFNEKIPYFMKRQLCKFQILEIIETPDGGAVYLLPGWSGGNTLLLMCAAEAH